jgi:hypothetical protein
MKVLFFHIQGNGNCIVRIWFHCQNTQHYTHNYLITVSMRLSIEDTLMMIHKRGIDWGKEYILLNSNSIHRCRDNWEVGGDWGHMSGSWCLYPCIQCTMSCRSRGIYKSFHIFQGGMHKEVYSLFHPCKRCSHSTVLGRSCIVRHTFHRGYSSRHQLQSIHPSTDMM